MLEPKEKTARRTRSQGGDETVIAIDLETTGLDPQIDRIIEFAAVKFDASGTVDEFTSLVNPRARLVPFITELTGIRQADVDGAPAFDTLSEQLREFIGTSAVVGHNVSFDASFLRKNGVPPLGIAYDTRDLAFVMLNSETEYGLERLSVRLKLGHDRPHRALYDARATRDLFMLLRDRMADLGPVTLERLRRIAATPDWPVAVLAARLLAKQQSGAGLPRLVSLGMGTSEVARRARPRWGARTGRPQPHSVGDFAKQVSEAFSAHGAVAGGLSGFEERPQQKEMADAIAAAVAEGTHLVIEAGTGVGKSLAYLIPAALHASRGGKSIIISTNTINLQEQLLAKDLPVARAVLGAARGDAADGLRASQLKGRANYICYKKWAYSAQTGAATEQDARVIAKCLVWLHETETGDKAEVGLSRDGAAFTRISAQGARGCPSNDGPCFLRKARTEAQTADIIVINHSLLLSEVAHDAGLLPEHDALIIDEAHHLEAVATRHLGFEVSEPQLGADLTALAGDRGLVAQLSQLCQSLAKTQALSPVPAATATALSGVARASEQAAQFFSAIKAFSSVHAVAGEERSGLRITPGIRAQPDWSGIEVAWENFDLPSGEALRGVASLVSQADSGSPLDDDAQTVLLNVAAVVDSLVRTRVCLKEAITEPSKESVYWIDLDDRGARGGGSSRQLAYVKSAPLKVGPLLAEKLFKNERCVILTGATLSSDGTFERLRAAVGLGPGRDLLLGSPFDYRSAALVAVPEDMPEPGSPGYAKAIATAISDIALAARDRVLVLFTSNSALEAARKAITPVLQRQGIRVVAQGTDGSPHRVMRELAGTKECVALGAASLWEGVDINSGAEINTGAASIKALIMPRLPFPVPSDPVFAARSELYEDGFNDYAVPEAVMRFRQGFGRLIRSKTDRGAFVVLDRRILSKQYGVAFQRALPKCTVRRTALAEVAEVVRGWNAKEEG